MSVGRIIAARRSVPREPSLSASVGAAKVSAMAARVTAWPLEPGLLSEGPRWDEYRRELLWVDILGSGFHRATLTPDGGPDQVRTLALDRHVGAVAPVSGGGYVLAAGQGFLFVDDAGSVHELAQPEAGQLNVRMIEIGRAH